MTRKDFGEFFSKMSGLDRWLLLLLIIGMVFLSIGLFRGIVEDSQVQVEIIKDDVVNVDRNIIVDVSGGVVSPGVYELAENSRIKDCLVVAGGLSADADREYIQRNINLVETVKDGQKIFIPKLSVSGSEVGYNEAILSKNKININSASVGELDTLKGIGAVRSQEIVSNRPYRDIEDLVTKGVISRSVLDKIKDQIVAY